MLNSVSAEPRGQSFGLKIALIDVQEARPESAMNFHSERVFSIPNFLSPSECESLIRLAEAHGFAAAQVRLSSGTRLLSNVRNNERVAFEAPPWRTLIWERASAHDLPVVEAVVPVGLPRELRFYKYTAGQRFKMHKDGPWLEDGLVSRLTFLIYLNEDFEGGETDFRDFKVGPVAGTAVLFLHDTWHEGAAVKSGRKYVLRSDILYTDPR